MIGIIGAVASVAGAMMQADAASEAAAGQQRSADAATAGQLEASRLSIAEQRRQYDLSIAEAQRQYDLSRGDLAPYRDAGTAGLNTIRRLIDAKGPYGQDVPFNGPQGLPEDAALPTFNYSGSPSDYSRTNGGTLGSLVRHSGQGNTWAGGGAESGGGVDPRSGMFTGTQGGEFNDRANDNSGEMRGAVEGGDRAAYERDMAAYADADYRGAKHELANPSMPRWQDYGLSGPTARMPEQATGSAPQGSPPEAAWRGAATVDQQGNVLPAQAAPGVEQFNAPEFNFDFKTDPGFQFRMGEGVNALQNSAAGRTGILSGNTLRGITEFGQGLASEEYGKAYGRARGEYTQDYGNAWDRYLNQLDLERQRYGRATSEETAAYGRATDQYGRDLARSNTQTGRNWNRYGQQYAAATDTYNRGMGNRTARLNTLQSLAGVGQQAVNTGTSLGANYANSVGNMSMNSANNIGNTMMSSANNIGNIGMNNANAQGASQIAGGNSISGGLSNASNFYAQQNTLNRLLSNQNRSNNYNASGDFQPYYNMSSDNYG